MERECQSCHTNIQECDNCISYDHYNPNKDRLKKRRKEMGRENIGEEECQH